jgi:DNA-binding transcriptional LysR family regulator
MRLSLDALLVLDAIDRKGSFAAAAEELFRVPSAVTYTVQKLEQDLDVALFDRSGHRAKLTAAGRELLEEGRHLLRAAAELENRVKRVATGWELELRIALEDLIEVERLFPLVEEFYRQQSGTRIRFNNEVLGGCWDALSSGRADLAIGVSGEGPAGGGYALHPMGSVEFVFCVAPHHPLTQVAEPLTDSDILPYRAVAAADSSRNLPPRTAGLISGQDCLTFSTMRQKLAAQVAGLGVGSLPRCMVREALADGALVEKRLRTQFPPAPFYLAWRANQPGKALAWWLEKLQAADLQSLIG